MKLKDIMMSDENIEPKLCRNFEDFINDKRSNEKTDIDAISKKKKKSKKIKKYSDLPLKTRKKIIKNLKFPSENNYYSKYGNRLDYYQ
jgi:hypothetical protein